MSWCMTSIWGGKGLDISRLCSLMVATCSLKQRAESSANVQQFCSYCPHSRTQFLASSCWYSILFKWLPTGLMCYLQLASHDHHLHMASSPLTMRGHTCCYQGPLKGPQVILCWSLHAAAWGVRGAWYFLLAGEPSCLHIAVLPHLLLSVVPRSILILLKYSSLMV